MITKAMASVRRLAESGALLVILASALPGLSQAQDQTLMPESVLASSEVHFPAILESLARRRGAGGEALQADGGFDLVFSADGFSRVDGFYDGTAAQARATQPLRSLGADAFLGYKISDGTFPIYEDINYTNTGGQLEVGVIFSLLRDRDIDDRRFAQVDAALNIREADFDVLLTKIGVQREALVAYWRWVTVGRQLEVYENLLSIALTREKALEEQTQSGARAEIFLVENRQNILRRQTLVTSARRDLRIAANALSYFYRDINGDPIVPTEAMLPATPPIGVVDDLAVSPTKGAGYSTSKALARRPELQILRTSLDRAMNRIRLAENTIKPRVDLNFRVSQPFGEVGDGGVSRDTTDTVIGVEFAVPLQRRSARGQLVQQQAQVDAFRQQQRLTENRIEVEVSNILLRLNVAQDLLELKGQEVEQAQIMAKAEERRFESGASDFFLVNVREERVADARVQYFAAELERRIARANYDAATVDTDRLGISEAAVLP